jgi:hypothetical protein
MAQPEVFLLTNCDEIVPFTVTDKHEACVVNAVFEPAVGHPPQRKQFVISSQTERLKTYVVSTNYIRSERKERKSLLLCNSPLK